MPKILMVDDNEAMLGLFRKRLRTRYEFIETSDPEMALAQALEHKPDAVLLDLMMPKFSGFELCQSLHSLSYTSLISIFVISGEDGARYKEQCAQLGAKGYFQKPVDFQALKAALEADFERKRPERRAGVRVKMRVDLQLRVTDANECDFAEFTVTENVSASGFLCECTASLNQGGVVEVFMGADPNRFAGRAQVKRMESPMSQWQLYGFRFVERTGEWILQPS